MPTGITTQDTHHTNIWQKTTATNRPYTSDGERLPSDMQLKRKPVKLEKGDGRYF